MNQQALIRGRMLARKFAMQAVYQWQLSGDNLDEIKQQFYDDEFATKADTAYFDILLQACEQYQNIIEEKIEQAIGYSIKRVDPVECAILRNAVYEILYVDDVNTNIIITEAIRLAKKFGAEGGYRFVNGVLDKIAKGKDIDRKRAD